MSRVAAVDCGTNSVRLLVADLGSDGTKTDVHRDMRIVRLGQDVDRTGEFAPEALERTRLALADYAAVSRGLGVERTRMVATSASRDVSNRAAFVRMVQDTLGAEPEVITGEQEAALSFTGATAGLDAALGPFLVVDIGGGSTELVLGQEGVEASASVDIGCVRLTERHLASDPPTAAEVAAAERDVAEALDRLLTAVPASRGRTLVGLAGSVTTVAALALGLETYDSAAIHHSRVSAEQVEQVTARLLAMSREQRAGLGVVHPGRVDVIGGGALVLRAVMRRLEAADVLVSESDILDGTALSMTTKEP